MISSSEIRNVTFSGSMAGYKKEEVDILLDKVEVDLEKYEMLVKQKDEKIAKLEEKLEDLYASQNTIQTALVNAQKLADRIVEEAKQESQKIVEDAQKNIVDMTEKSKIIAEELDNKATEKKQRLEADLAKIIAETENKKAAIERAAESSVRKQQQLFNELKTQVAEFKAEITEKYKSHLSILSSLPDKVDDDPFTAAKIAAEQSEKEEIAEEESEPMTDDTTAAIDSVTAECNDDFGEVSETESSLENLYGFETDKGDDFVSEKLEETEEAEEEPTEEEQEPEEEFLEAELAEEEETASAEEPKQEYEIDYFKFEKSDEGAKEESEDDGFFESADETLEGIVDDDDETIDDRFDSFEEDENKSDGDSDAFVSGSFDVSEFEFEDDSDK